MSITILNGFESESPIINSCKKLLEEMGEDFIYFHLKEMNILPCKSCGSCGHRTPGECILDDDIHGVLRAMARSEVLILLTPIRFGGFSSQIKKAWDRAMVMGLPLYIVKDGHMLHPMRYGDKALIAIGIIEDDVTGQEENFKLTLERNALNMQSSYHKTLIFNSTGKSDEFKTAVENVLKEVI